MYKQKSAAMELVEVTGVDKQRKKSFMFYEEDEEGDVKMDSHSFAPLPLTPATLVHYL